MNGMSQQVSTLIGHRGDRHTMRTRVGDLGGVEGVRGRWGPRAEGMQAPAASPVHAEAPFLENMLRWQLGPQHIQLQVTCTGNT